MNVQGKPKKGNKPRPHALVSGAVLCLASCVWGCSDQYPEVGPNYWSHPKFKDRGQRDTESTNTNYLCGSHPRHLSDQYPEVGPNWSHLEFKGPGQRDTESTNTNNLCSSHLRRLSDQYPRSGAELVPPQIQRTRAARYRDQYPEVGPNRSHLRFKGRGQRGTPATLPPSEAGRTHQHPLTI